MATDPSSETPGDSTGDSTGESPEEDRDRAAAEDAAWRAIVANFGERAVLDDLDPPESTEPPRPPASPVPALAEEDEHYVPPPPPPLPRPAPERLLAWVGLFGVPLMVLVAVVLGIAFPTWLAMLLLGWFVGGFVFLVATMRDRPDDPDDGAVV